MYISGQGSLGCRLGQFCGLAVLGRLVRNPTHPQQFGVATKEHGESLQQAVLQPLRLSTAQSYHGSGLYQCGVLAFLA